jgi:hypothetical protein
MAFYKHIVLASVAISLVACGTTKEEKLTSYSKEIASYDCNSLTTEDQFNTKVIDKIRVAKKQHNSAVDVAVTVMTLGTDLIPDGASPSTATNYDNRIALLREKKELIKRTREEKCRV